MNLVYFFVNTDLLYVQGPATEEKKVPYRIRRFHPRRHKVILANSSKVFRAMFLQNMKEKEESRVTIMEPVLDVKTVEAMLLYIYARKVDHEISSSLLIAAELYELPALKHICECNLAEGLDKDNAVDILLLADQYNAEGLKSVAMKYIVDKHMIQEMNVEEMKGNPDLLAALCEAMMVAHRLPKRD